MNQKEKTFTQTVWDYYNTNKRPMKWRDNPSPYYVVVSELMLQQTQVPRVIEKFDEFTRTFPNFESLAQASLQDVLQVWIGLGYNRRAKFLHEIAKEVIHTHNGKLPQTKDELVKLKGIGPNTAGAILAYVYNSPQVYIETNIRAVYLHHFFQDEIGVDDNQLLPLISKTLDTHNPREWYWALMDYGTYIKKMHPNPSRKSKHHTKQSKFEGSTRQLRAKILSYLVSQPDSVEGIYQHTNKDSRTKEALAGMVRDGLIRHEGTVYTIKN